MTTQIILNVNSNSAYAQYNGKSFTVLKEYANGSVDIDLKGVDTQFSASEIIKLLENVITAKQIKELGNVTISQDFNNSNGVKKDIILVNGVNTFYFTDRNLFRKSYNKMISAKNISRGFRFDTDEDRGIKQAGDNGENPFAYQIIEA